jgi:hypothetical protein
VKLQKYLILSLVAVLGTFLVVQTVAAASNGIGWWKSRPPGEWPTGTIYLGEMSVILPEEVEKLFNMPGQPAVWMIGKGAQPGRCTGQCHMELPAWHSFDGIVQAKFILGEKIITAQFELLANDVVDPYLLPFISEANEVYATSTDRAELLYQATLVNAALNQYLHDN